MNKEVKGCDDCPFNGDNDTDHSAYCSINLTNSIPYKETEMIPVTPDWCPLKKESITISLIR